MRLAGILILSLAAFAVGIVKYNRLRSNAYQAELSVRCVEDVKDSIRYTARHSGDILAEMAEKYKNLEWLNSQSGGEIYDLGRQFCKGLGATDIEGQMNYCNMYIHRFRSLYDTARRELTEKGRLYIALGAFSGLGVFILFI